MKDEYTHGAVFASNVKDKTNLFVKITDENLVIPCDESGKEVSGVTSVIYKNAVNEIVTCTMTFHPCGIIKANG